MTGFGVFETGSYVERRWKKVRRKFMKNRNIKAEVQRKNKSIDIEFIGQDERLRSIWN